MSLLQERLSRSMKDAAITDVIEEYHCSKGNVGFYGAQHQGRRIVLVAVLDENNLSVSTPNEKELINLLVLVRKLMHICAIEPMVLKKQS